LLPDAEGNRTKLSGSPPLLLQINIDGKIGADKLTGKSIEDILLASREDALKDGRVKGVLLFINSPGGGVNDSDAIYRLVKEYKEQHHLPVFAYVDGVCASGGYYIACAADKIYASGSSIVGSIGVLIWPPFMNVADTLEKLGVNALTVSAGKGKDTLNPFRNWRPDEAQQYQSLIDFYYHQFIDIVAASRSISAEEIVRNIGAKILPAPEASRAGLIDYCGASRQQALTELAQTAGITGKYQVVGFESKSWWKKAFKEEGYGSLFSRKVKHEITLPTLEGNPFSYIFVP
jgi:protease-4